MTTDPDLATEERRKEGLLRLTAQAGWVKNSVLPARDSGQRGSEASDANVRAAQDERVGAGGGEAKSAIAE
ncbi:hypothetical protein [Thermogemmatispora carboxidivorans]|uniref:hypothetical protein n=1 Tax=Thermogemmatispora carboxidivorans TaxID=1382306 RepID=UPI00069C9CCB|nr:hypothetical protein [Thermogemmatispora carboxidivorans]